MLISIWLVKPLRTNSARLYSVSAPISSESSSSATSVSGRAYDRPFSMMPRVGEPAATWVWPLTRPGSNRLPVRLIRSLPASGPGPTSTIRLPAMRTETPCSTRLPCGPDRKTGRVLQDDVDDAIIRPSSRHASLIFSRQRPMGHQTRPCATEPELAQRLPAIYHACSH